MPARAPRYCSFAGCQHFAVTGGRCRDHQRAYEVTRRTTPERALYHEARWRRERARFLRRQANLLCLYCLAEDRVTPATSVDHDPPHDGDRAKFYDQSTWRPSCVSCNSRRANARRRALRVTA
jgi:5-methylcytosine-specific restriction protein A